MRAHTSPRQLRSHPATHLAVVLTALVALSGCTTPGDGTHDARLPCELVEAASARYCVGNYWITETGFSCAPDDVGCMAITETGFSCPPDMGNLIRQGDHFVCASDGGLTPEQRDDVIATAVPDASCVSVREPTGDADGDRIPNAWEDRDRNCIHDDGELDYLDSDTDDDGLTDGLEDHNHNGIFEPYRGELNPLDPDTDGDGIGDADEWTSAHCHAGSLANPSPTLSTPRVNLALPNGFSIKPVNAMAAARFEDAARGVFGFVAERPLDGSGEINLALEHGLNLFAIASAGHLPINELQSAPFAAWSWAGLDGSWLMPPRRAIQSQELFAYGPGTANETTLAPTPGGLRDVALTALTNAPPGSLPTTTQPGPTCDRLVLRQFISPHPDTAHTATPTVLVVGVIACATRLELDPDLFELFDDIGSGTLVAPVVGGQSFELRGVRCEEREVPATVGQLDVLWVIDNSGSMGDEQLAVSDSASALLDTLQSSELDWRIGVTTTDAWLLDRDDISPPVVDPLLDLASGLRGIGFLAPDEVATHFHDYVTAWPGCTHDAAAPDTNICGYGYETGLSSGLKVLTRTANDTRPRHQLRDEAVPLVVFVSDEEDLNFKDNPPGTQAWSATDPRREILARSMAGEYNELGALTCAIVGDAGVAANGSCLAPDLAANIGAEHGLGYIEVARRTGGVSGSLCQPALESTVEACLRRAIARTTNYPMLATPLPTDMRVFVDDVEIVRDGRSGWSYDANANALVFYDVELAPTSTILTVFRSWEPRFH